MQEKAKRRWNPDSDKVSEKETVGRQAFGRCFVAEGGGGLPAGYFRIDVFYEDRTTEHLSLDRLGMKRVDEDVVRHLTPVADKNGASQNKDFICWAAIKMKALSGFDIRPKKEDDNEYHCELNLDKYRERQHAELLAFKLSHLATRVEPIRGDTEPKA